MTPPIDALATDAERRQQIALFRYGLIADLVQLPPNYRGLYKLLTEKAAREYDIPFSLRRRVAAETMRGWLRDYRRGGFDALLPKVRSDVGSARSIPAAVVDLLCELKDSQSELSTPAQRPPTAPGSRRHCARRARPLPRAPSASRRMRAPALRAAHHRGHLPGLQRPPAQGQPTCPSRPLRRRHREGQVHHHRAHPGRASGSRVANVLSRRGAGAITRSRRPSLSVNRSPPRSRSHKPRDRAGHVTKAAGRSPVGKRGRQQPPTTSTPTCASASSSPVPRTSH